MKTIHELKTWPEFFNQTRNGRKKFELRQNDRDFKVGDELLLKEWSPVETVSSNMRVNEPGYTGRELRVQVDYIMTANAAQFNDFGVLDADYVIMSVSLVS